jgi:hypothetical protein
MENQPHRMRLCSSGFKAADRSYRRRHDRTHSRRGHASWNPILVFVVGVVALAAAPCNAVAQEPTIPPLPANPGPYLVPPHRHHWWSCLTANDGIPRTYSYYYSPYLNQPSHLPVAGPDGKRYWITRVRGLPMGSQWLAP